MTTVMTAGIFSTEAGQRLLHILLALAERGFRGLYEKCKHNLGGEYFRVGLQRVHRWSDGVIGEDIEFVQRSCPDINETYDACFTQYVDERYRGRARTTARAPALIVFVRSFLEFLGQHEALQQGDYFQRRDPMLKRLACMEAARQALYGLADGESVRVELASEAGAGSTTVSRRLADATPADVALAVDDVVAPSDSISQVGGALRREPAEPPLPPVRAPTVVSQRVEREEEEEGDVRAPTVVSRAVGSDEALEKEVVNYRAPSPPPRSPTASHVSATPRGGGVGLQPTPTVPQVAAETRAPSVVSAASVRRPPSVIVPPLETRGLLEDDARHDFELEDAVVSASPPPKKFSSSGASTVSTARTSRVGVKKVSSPRAP